MGEITRIGEFGAELPAWTLAEEAFPELQEEARHHAVSFLGGIAIRGEADEVVTPNRTNETSLMAASQMAALGDERARRVVYNNAAADVAERLFKAAHQTKIHMKMVDGHLEQEGRRLTDIHRSTLEHTVLNGEMLRRSNYELQNAILFQRLHQAGVLEGFDAVVFSPSPTAMSIEEKRQYGLFVDTESCSIQYLTASGQDITLETAFVAGKLSPTSPRHDLKAIQKLAEMHGLNLQAVDGTELLRHVILIPKEQAEGVAGVVEWYDDAAGGTFYGQANPRQDYQVYAAQCLERSRDFEGMVQNIVDQLICESHSFKSPLDAIMRLDELSAQFSRERAVHDVSIDVAVFGEQAAMHIQEARFFLERGELDRAESAMEMARKTDQSSSCPLFKSIVNEGGGDDPSGASSNEEVGGKKWGNCPYCQALVYVDPCAKRITCIDCTAMVVDGKIISRGNGGTRKRRAEAEAKRTHEKAVSAGSLALVHA